MLPLMFALLTHYAIVLQGKFVFLFFFSVHCVLMKVIYTVFGLFGVYLKSRDLTRSIPQIKKNC